MLIAAAKSANIYSLLDFVFSVETVSIFKPHPSTYQIAVEQLKIPADHISFQSSNSWDAHAAAASGFVVAWVNRFDQPPEILPESPHAEIKTLADLPPLLNLSSSNDELYWTQDYNLR